MFNTQEAKLYLLDAKDEKLWRYNHQGQKLIYTRNSGIIGLSINYQQIVLISNPMKDTHYSSLIDIDTHMPIIAVPIICSVSKKLIGAFEVINTRGIEGMSETGMANLSPRDYEIQDFFSKQSAQCIQSTEDYLEECDQDLGILLSKSLVNLSKINIVDRDKKLNCYLFNDNNNESQKLFQSNTEFNKEENKKMAQSLLSLRK